MKTEKLNVNFRWDKKEGYLFAVIGKNICDKYTCYDLCSCEHFEATAEYLRTTEIVTVKKWLSINNAISQLSRIGYNHIRIAKRIHY